MPDSLIVIPAVLAALLIVQILHVTFRRLGRRSALLGELAARAHRPTQLAASLVALEVAIEATTTTGDWRRPLLHALWLAIIGAGAWLIASLLLVLEDVALARYRTDVEDNRHARRIHTQVTVVRRVTVAVVALVAFGAMLVTFPAARAAGTSLLASAGVAGVIAGFAAQSLLSNVLAGIQIAFSDSLRLDDVVVVEKEWGRVEEITLSYVVVHIWDDRRLILPTSYFTTKPFENWTRTSAAVLGTVELDADWSLPIEEARQELTRILEGADLWDGRVGVLQVTEVLGPYVRLRALVSAPDAPTLWDLRCLVREALVRWLRERYPDALPRLRTEPIDERGGRPAELPSRSEPAGDAGDDDAHVFSGSRAGRERGEAFTGPEEEPQADTQPKP